MPLPIDIETKQKCVDAYNDGKSPKEIFNTIYHEANPRASYETFKRSMRRWKRSAFPGDKTLSAGTYEGFKAHSATVQVDAHGEVVQAWVKQTLDDGQWDALLDVIHANTEPVRIEPLRQDGIGMLEIPLFDLHLPLSDHAESIGELLGIVERQKWAEVNIIVGQDMFHNDDMRGRTSSGKQIEKVDIPLAWEMARSIWFSVIETALRNADKVNLVYSKGNHDESLSWCFVQMLKDHYPQICVDDRLKQRKCIYWNNCFIGLTHGSYQRSKANDLRGQFTIEYPVEFATATVREIHTGHLHHETEGDLYGVMVRRLSRNGTTDQWSEDEGFVGALRRFMIFEWMPGRLKAIYYI